jgi:hypothetical protein
MWDQFEHWEQRRGQFVKEPLSHYESISKALDFTGSSCESIRPFRFLAIDPWHIPHFTRIALGKHFETGTGKNESFRRMPDSRVTDPIAYIIDAQVNI